MKILFDDRAMVVSEVTKPSLLIADLHLGRHMDIERRYGVAFPAQYQAMLTRIKQLVSKYNIAAIYILGDLKHSIGADRLFNWEIIPEFIEQLQNYSEVVVIPGNHDGDLHALLPRSTRVEDVHGVIVTEEAPHIAAIHGHAWPSERTLSASIIVMGHNHPTLSITRVAKTAQNYTIKRSGGVIPVVIKARYSKNCVRRHIRVPEDPTDETGTLFVLPSFDALSTGNRINLPSSSFQGPLLEGECTDTLTAEVHSTDGIYLGTVAELRERQRND